jgi:hypothetical protein
MRTKLRAKKDDPNFQPTADSTIGNSSYSSSSNSAALERRAADLLSNGGVDLSTFSEPKPDSKTLAEIREGAERLATELDEFLSKKDGSNSPSYSSPFCLLGGGADGSSKTSLTDEQIADLQLAVARKLREVRMLL